MRVNRFRATSYRFVGPKFLGVKYGMNMKLRSLLRRYVTGIRAARLEVIWQENETDRSRPINVEVKEFMGVC